MKGARHIAFPSEEEKQYGIPTPWVFGTSVWRRGGFKCSIIQPVPCFWKLLLPVGCFLQKVGGRLCSGSADGYPLTFYTAGILKWIFGVCQRITHGVPAFKLQQSEDAVIVPFSSCLRDLGI